MNDEIMTEVLTEKNITDDDIKSPAPVCAEKEKITKSDKRLEKLLSLREKYEKAATAQATATKKANDINAQISKIEKEIHAEEVAEIDRLCEEKNLSYKDIALILKSIPAGMTAENVSRLFDKE